MSNWHIHCLHVSSRNQLHAVDDEEDARDVQELQRQGVDEVVVDVEPVLDLVRGRGPVEEVGQDALRDVVDVDV